MINALTSQGRPDERAVRRAPMHTACTVAKGHKLGKYSLDASSEIFPENLTGTCHRHHKMVRCCGSTTATHPDFRSPLPPKNTKHITVTIFYWVCPVGIRVPSRPQNAHLLVSLVPRKGPLPELFKCRAGSYCLPSPGHPAAGSQTIHFVEPCK